MSNSYFQFKQFIIHQDKCAMKVTTDACLFGAWVANEIKTNSLQSKNLLDIGAGTGLLSLLIAQENSSLVIDAIEIDEDAYKQANENSSNSKYADRITTLHGDARDFVFNKKYDLIVSNPPFYENELSSDNASKNMAHHSTELLLSDLLKLIKQHLNPDGSFYLLLPYKREKEMNKLFETAGLSVSKKIFVRQSVKHDFFRVLIAGKTAKETEPLQAKFSIWNEERQYTNEFIALLKNFYLHL